MSAVWLVWVFLVLGAGRGVPQGASVSGRVTDKASGQPIPRMVVALVSPNRTQVRETFTDGQGRYQFVDVAPGQYSVGADNDDHHATYLRQWFGVAEPASVLSAAPPANLEVAPGQSRADVDLALTRALAIEGRVLDALGNPLEDITVTVVTPDGRMVALPSARSDDLGAYRIYGLAPGRYRVCADIHTRMPVSWPTDRPVPPRTCYPATPDDRDAADVDVSTQDAVNIEIQMLGTEGAALASSSDRKDAIHGRVFDKESGKPISHAAVRIAQRGNSGDVKDVSTMTDSDSVFRFPDLPGGRYTGFVEAPRYRIATLEDASHSRDLTVRPGETLDLPAALPRAYAINVRLVDEFDSPISDIKVTVRSENGGAASAITAFGVMSDDRGHVRLSDIAPGRYVICAEQPDYSASGRKPAKPEQFLHTCYPATLNDADAQAVVVTNEDVEDLELRMVRGRVLSISGTILDASGAPARAIAALARYATGSSTSRGFDVDERGRFRIVNVLPGAYAIEATKESDAAFVPIRLDNDDLENVVIAMQKTTTVRGRIALEDPSAAIPNPRAPLTVQARLAVDRLPGMASTRVAVTDDDRTFTLEEMFGRRSIDVTNVPSGWFVKAIRYGSKDVTDEPVEFKTANQPLDIVLSNRGASIAGTIAEVTDHRIKDAQVFLFRPAPSANDVPRLVGAVLSVTGNYSFGPLREGEYIILAVPSSVRGPVAGEWDRMTQLAALGERVTVTELEQRSVELHVTSIR